MAVGLAGWLGGMPCPALGTGGMLPQGTRCKPFTCHAMPGLHMSPPAVQDATPDACPSPTTVCKDKLHRSFQLAKLQVRCGAVQCGGLLLVVRVSL